MYSDPTEFKEILATQFNLIEFLYLQNHADFKFLIKYPKGLESFSQTQIF